MTEMTEPPHQTPPFLETKEYRRFAEFCDACRRYRYIGLCYGPPGVGKTLSARHYARWGELGISPGRTVVDSRARPELVDCRTVLFTPSLTTTPKSLAHDISSLCWSLHYAVEAAHHAGEDDPDLALYDGRWTELVLVDEADRLKLQTLEQLRDVYDRGTFGLVLIGMPGLEKQMARYAQFYSRVGFVHVFRPLSAEELRFILEHKWKELGLTIDLSEFADVEAMTTIVRITGGNFRLVQRMFDQIGRIVEINHLSRVTKEVVDTARQSLVIGVS